MSDIDTAVVDSLKALDPRRPIREADIAAQPPDVRFRGVKRTWLPQRKMSANGTKRTWRDYRSMSAFSRTPPLRIG